MNWRWGCGGDKVINSWCHQIRVQGPRLQEETRGGQVTSNSPAALSLSTVNQCPRSIGEFAMAACRARGVPGGTRSHSVLLADDRHGQQPILLSELFAQLGLRETQVADAALHLLHLHLHQRQDVPLLVQLAQELLLRGA